MKQLQAQRQAHLRKHGPHSGARVHHAGAHYPGASSNEDEDEDEELLTDEDVILQRVKLISAQHAKAKQQVTKDGDDDEEDEEDEDLSEENDELMAVSLRQLTQHKRMKSTLHKHMKGRLLSVDLLGVIWKN